MGEAADALKAKPANWPQMLTSEARAKLQRYMEALEKGAELYQDDKDGLTSATKGGSDDSPNVQN